jgi:hypothetical protein
VSAYVWRNGQNPLIVEQIVEPFFPGIFGVDRFAPDDFATDFHGIPHLVEITEIAFFFKGDICLDRLPALKSTGRVEMTAATATPEIRTAVRAAVRSHHAAGDTGRLATTPAQQSFVAHIKPPIHDPVSFRSCIDYTKVLGIWETVL